MKEKIGIRIKEARNSRNISQERLAELADVSLSCISRLETGKTMVSVEKLILIAEVLNVSIGDLLQDFIKDYRVEDQIIDQISRLLSTCSKEEQTYWVESLQLYITRMKNKE